MGWHPDEVRVVCGIICREVKVLFMDPETAGGLSFKVRVLKGRKPTIAEQNHRAKKDHRGETMATMRKRKKTWVQDEAASGS